MEQPELWKDVIGYEGIYLVSNKGSVKNMITGKVLKAWTNSRRYYYFGLSKNGHQSQLRVHRLVATAFIPNPLNKPEVNHLDGNKKNNSVENLEWVTPSENVRHSWRAGLSKITDQQKVQMSIRAKTRTKAVINVITGEEFESVASAAESVGLSPSGLSSKLLGKRKNNTSLTFKV